MRIKTQPEDFVVYEVADIAPEGEGPYALYRLYKRGATTWDVLGDIAKRLRRRYNELGYGGLKDRQAVSYQFVTLKHGPKRDLAGRNYRLEYLGQTSVPMTKSRLRGNRFRILVRDVETAGLEEEVLSLRSYGVVNYFDEQRFGSVRGSGEFAIRELILGHYEKALYLLLAEGSQYEIKRTQTFRECLRRHWPQVAPCLELAPSPWERRLLQFLTVHRPSKRTFKRAFALVDREYLLLLCHAYQAYIWNETVKKILKDFGLSLLPVTYLLGELLFYRDLPQEALERLKSLKLPLPSPRLHLEPWLTQAMETVLQREGISELAKFRTLAKGATFKTYPREVIVFPEDLRYEVKGPREVLLEFFLPKGSYATIILKRLFLLRENSG